MDTISAEQRGAGMRKTFANIDAIIALCSCVRALIRRMPGTFKGRTRLRIRDAFIASLLGIVGYAGTASANSCANVDVMGSFDESGLRENASGIYAAGTFRIAGEEDESKQPMFNLAMINCEKSDDASASFECKITKAVVWAQSGNPNPDNPNCSLDLDASAYQMKELQRGILSGIETTTQCFNSMLTIDRNTKRVYLSFTRTTYADNYDKIRPGTCGMSPRTQVLMNCTGWPRMRKQGRAPPRYCDFSSSKDK
ncbi:MAG TPA: hypothetical protein VFB45_26640 [Pseudolabrys sp.]|nr:hypothetical protein [Pseudolabrys sp.]